MLARMLTPGALHRVETLWSVERARRSAKLANMNPRPPNQVRVTPTTALTEVKNKISRRRGPGSV